MSNIDTNCCEKRKSWVVFSLVFVLLLFKTMTFHWGVFRSVLLSSLTKNPLEFFAFWIPKLLPVLLISSFVFLSKKKCWVAVIAILLDIWCVANMFYFKAYSMFITVDVMKMASNLQGFGNTLLLYFDVYVWMLPVSTILFIVIMSLFHLWKSEIRMPVNFWIFFLGTLCLSLVDKSIYAKQIEKDRM